jgi:nucleoside 2-deoxyribosyltransferase
MNCPIWGTPAQLLEGGGDFQVVDSPRAGGKYSISGTAAGQLVSFTDNAKLLLTTWLCQQRHAGVEIPKLESNILDLVKSRRRLSVTQRLTAGLLFLGNEIQRLGDSVKLIGGDGGQITARCLAETESAHARELNQLFILLRELGQIQGSFMIGGAMDIHPTAAGWHELEKLNRPQSDSSQAFVAMWFDEKTNEAYVNGIEPAIRESGYKAIRIDKKEHNNKIDDEILAEIRRSRFLVADFTSEQKSPRGGVYYEAGFAQGLGIPVIWTCKDTSIDDLHFDTRQYAHIKWTTPGDLRTQLKNRIGATIGDGPLPKT